MRFLAVFFFVFLLLFFYRSDFTFVLMYSHCREGYQPNRFHRNIHIALKFRLLTRRHVPHHRQREEDGTCGLCIFVCEVKLIVDSWRCESSPNNCENHVVWKKGAEKGSDEKHKV